MKHSGGHGGHSQGRGLRPHAREANSRPPYYKRNYRTPLDILNVIKAYYVDALFKVLTLHLYWLTLRYSLGQ